MHVHQRSARLSWGKLAAVAGAVAVLATATGVAAGVSGKDAVAEAAVLVEPSSGQTFGRYVTVDGTSFHCLGTGVRKLAFIKVYALAFCVEERAAMALQERLRAEDPAVIAEHVGTVSADRLVVIRPLRDMSRGRVGDAFRDSLESVLPEAKVAALVALVPRDALEGQTVRVFSSGDRLTFDIDGERRTLTDAETADKIWQVWLGPDSVAPSVKKSIAEQMASWRKRGVFAAPTTRPPPVASAEGSTPPR